MIPLLLPQSQVGWSGAFWVDGTPWLTTLPFTEAFWELSMAISWSWLTSEVWVMFPTNVRFSSFLAGATAMALVGATWLLLTVVGWGWLKLLTRVRVSIFSGVFDMGVLTTPLCRSWATAYPLDSLQNLPTNIWKRYNNYNEFVKQIG